MPGNNSSSCKSLPARQHIPLGEMEKQTLFKRDLSSTARLLSRSHHSTHGSSHGLGPSEPLQHTPKGCFPPLCSFLSVSRSLLGECQEEPGFVLVKIFIWEVVVLKMLLQAAFCSQQAPKLPQHSLSHLEELLCFETGGAAGASR